MAMKLVRPARGRPRKFGRPSRAVTLTLPEDVIAVLGSIDDDLSRAVVNLTQPLLADVVSRAPAELEKYGDSAVIVVRPATALKSVPGVELVPLPDGRALISLDGSVTVHELELRLRDAIAEGGLQRGDLSVLGSIADILKTARRTKGLAVLERSIIVLQSAQNRRILG
jgi:hypothetical protein